MSICPKELKIDDIEINSELGLSEDHFSRPEGLFGFSNVEEIEISIENCKELILETAEMSEKRKKLVQKLVQLRYQLLELKDHVSESPPHEKLLMGHKFLKRTQIDKSGEYCEKCCRLIITVLHTWYYCTECSYRCHNKCLNSINRSCPSLKIQDDPTYILDICPEIGLAQQKYRCAECRHHILYKVGYAAPKLCEYTGLYFCSYCHWENSSIIPARVIRNWDFDPKKVSRSSLQFLRLMNTKSIINLEKLNPALFGFVEELAICKRLREEILVMKRYFLSCHAALESKLLLKLKERQHFVENSNIYSLQDLIDIKSGILLEFLKETHLCFKKHIEDDCESCRGKGFICEICRKEELLFPFQENRIACPKCSSLFHWDCYEKHKPYCPKCERRALKS